ncbi:MAG: hypothetical protein ACT4P7_20120 [Gemmatimonadaceae bacterium]
MIVLPPYALTPPTFRFRALVALAERLPLGGERELVLATFRSARVLWDWQGAGALPRLATQGRAHAARQWLQSLSLPQQTRAVFQQLADAIARDDQPAAIASWDRALALATRIVDGAARADFKALAGRLNDSAAAQ